MCKGMCMTYMMEDTVEILSLILSVLMFVIGETEQHNIMQKCQSRRCFRVQTSPSLIGFFNPNLTLATKPQNIFQVWVFHTAPSLFFVQRNKTNEVQRSRNNE